MAVIALAVIALAVIALVAGKLADGCPFQAALPHPANLATSRAPLRVGTGPLPGREY